MHCIVSMFKGREAWKGSLIFWKLISVAVLFLPFSFAQTKGTLTWAPLWVRYWGRRYCLEPRNKRGHPSLKQPTGTPFLTKPLSWMKWALQWTPQPQKKAPEHLVLSKVVLCTEQRLHGAAFPRHSSGSREGRRRHRSSSSISIRTPFSALPIRGLPPCPRSTLNHSLRLGRFLSTWNLWRMVGFGHFSSSISSEIPEASTTRARKYWNESDKSTRI